MITPKITNLGYSNLWTDMSTILGYASNFQKLITKLFSNGEQGFAYDPNDLTTLYQDAAWTVPVTSVGQPVGLILDKSKGLLTTEKVVNSHFATDTSWSKGANVTISNGSAILSGATGNPVLSQNVGLTAGKWYEVTVNVTEVTNSLIRFRIYGGGGGSDVIFSITSVGIYKARVMARSDATGLIGFSATSKSVKISSVSVKELAGNHTYQATSAARPILRDVPRRIDFDTVDDKLITNLPAQLTGCTVVRSVPNVGTQILTGQTIPATYENNTDHCGLIVINRALTPSETSAITSEFNKRAGV